MRKRKPKEELTSKYYAENREKYIALAKAWREAHARKMRAYSRRYYRQHRDYWRERLKDENTHKEHLQYLHDRYHNNVDIREKMKQYAREYYLRNREAISKKRKQRYQRLKAVAKAEECA